MYDRPNLRQSHKRLWELIREQLRAKGFDAPNALSDGVGIDFWSRSDLLFSQTCGLPFRSKLHSLVSLVGTPDYGVAGCPPGYYRSVLIRRKGTSTGGLTGRFALNGWDSQSGYAAPKTHLGDRAQFSDWIVTGSHLASVRAVEEGRAEYAAIDAVTWALLLEDNAPNRVEVFDQTEPTPGLPFICARVVDPQPVRDAVKDSIQQLAAGDRAALRLRGLVEIPEEAYLSVPTPPRPPMEGSDHLLDE